MSELTNAARRFWNDEEGATMAEYALLLGLIAIALVAAVSAFQGAIGDKFKDAEDALEAAGTEGGGGTE